MMGNKYKQTNKQAKNRTNGTIEKKINRKKWQSYINNLRDDEGKEENNGEPISFNLHLILLYFPLLHSASPLVSK